ncbi:MAG: heparinase II/III family protein [Bacteroidales bacterium]|nr:heparinase II/III family protein [Bacteroidales bacterium]
MKHILFISLFCFFLTSVFGKEINLENRKMPKHPRLILLKGEEKKLKKQIQKDSLWSSINEKMIKRADNLLEKPLSQRKLTGRRLLSVSRDNLAKIFCLSYAYRMTNDKKYALSAEKEMVNMAEFSDWNPSHFLDVAEMCMAISIGYDWLYDVISDDTKNIVKEAIRTKALEPSFNKKYNWFVTAENNWNQVCHSGVSFGALAVWEENPQYSASIVERAIENMAIPMKLYAPAGAYPEGCSYWEYGTSFNVLFLSAIDKIFKSDFGLSSIPGFLKTGEYATQMITPSLNTFCYSDNGGRAIFSPTIFWFYNKTKDTSLLFMPKKILEKSRNDSYVNDRIAPAMIIWGAAAGFSSPKYPKNTFWIADGENPVCIIRENFNDEKAAYVGVKAGSPFVNHGHMDVGSFIFESDGVRWALDMGAENYTNLEAAKVDLWNRSQNSGRWDVYRYNNFAHNTLTINGKYQKVKGNAKFNAFDRSEKSPFVYMDLSDIYSEDAKMVTRKVGLIDNRVLVVSDTVVIKNENNDNSVAWSLITEGNPTIDENNVVWLEKNGKKVKLYNNMIGKGSWSIEDAKPSTTYESKNNGVKIVRFTYNDKKFLNPFILETKIERIAN